jgi:hypothetical protein
MTRVHPDGASKRYSRNTANALSLGAAEAATKTLLPVVGCGHRRAGSTLRRRCQAPAPRRAAQRSPVVLDPDRGGLGGAQGVDAKQVGERAVVNADGLGDLEEPDELQPVQPLARVSSACSFGSRT